MAVPKKRVSRTRKNLRHTQWKKEILPQALQALSMGKSKLGKPSTESNVESQESAQ
jgi:ribosomal protein L32